jgi:hypothetical protein
MKTKTLLIAAAALAAGVISSQAQVYSQNIVGYANIVTASAGANYLLSVPFKIGVSNGANEVFPNIPEFSSILIWNVGSSSYASYQTDTGSPTGWTDGASPVGPPVLPVGQGFFLSPADNNVTNTLAGSIVINVGTSNVMTLPAAGANYLVGCVVPYAGAVTNGNSMGGGPNLNNLPEFSSVLIWNPLTSAYSSYQTDTGSATGWTDGASPVAPPSITVGQGFFISPSDNNAKWTTGL